MNVNNKTEIDKTDLLGYSIYMIYDKYNKGFVINDLYVGKPFVFQNKSDEVWRRIQYPIPFIRLGQLMEFDVKEDKYVIGWLGVYTHSDRTYVRYTLHELLHTKPFHYGYFVGQKVIRVTDGGDFTISEINWKINDLYVRTEEDGKKAKLSYGLFIPRPHEIFDINPFAHHERFPNELFNIS